MIPEALHYAFYMLQCAIISWPLNETQSLYETSHNSRQYGIIIKPDPAAIVYGNKTTYVYTYVPNLLTGCFLDFWHFYSGMYEFRPAKWGIGGMGGGNNNHENTV